MLIKFLFSVFYTNYRKEKGLAADSITWKYHG